MGGRGVDICCVWLLYFAFSFWGLCFVVGFRSGVGFAFDLDVVLVYIRFGVWFSIWLGFGCGLHLVLTSGSVSIWFWSWFRHLIFDFTFMWFWFSFWRLYHACVFLSELSSQHSDILGCRAPCKYLFCFWRRRSCAKAKHSLRNGTANSICTQLIGRLGPPCFFHGAGTMRLL